MDHTHPILAGSEERQRRAPRGLPGKTQLGLLAMIAVLLAAGIFAATHWISQSKVAETATATTPDGSFQATAQQWSSFRIVPVQERTFRPAQETDGKIAIDDDLTTPVFSPYSGRVTQIFVKTGDTVHQGTPLLAIQASEFVQAQNDLVSAASALATARAQLDLAQTNEKRQHALYQAQGGALKDWQQSKVDLATAEGSFQTAQIALAAVRNRLRILGRSDSEIAAIEKAPDLMKMNPEALVRAPVGGVIVQRQVGLGQNVISAASGASTPLFSIGDFSKVWLVANIRETDAPAIHLGDPVEVHVLAYPGRVFKARITYVAPSIDPNTHRLPVRAEVENPDGLLKPEMFASFTIITGAASDSPAVPADAIVYEGDTAHVWVARDDKRLMLRPIRTGLTSEGMVQVLSGLKPGEKVVTAGSLFIDRAAEGD